MRVLFVDDEVQVLRGLKRMFSTSEQDWEAHFVSSGQEALARLAAEPFDAIVSDMRMPGMDGAELLERVSQEHPHLVRVVLSGQANREAVLRAVGPMHQYLSKPCDSQQLKATLDRACALREILSSPSLKQLINGTKSLPSLPSVYNELMAAVGSEETTLADIGKIVAADPAMTAKILHVANSALFGLSQSVTAPSQAVSLLGIETIKALVLSVGIFQRYEGKTMVGVSVEQVLTHSLQVGQLAARIAKRESVDKHVAADAFTAGVLHDMGRVVLAINRPDEYAAVIERSRAEPILLADAETELLGDSHAALGGFLLSLWGLPQSVIETVSWHHDPAKSHDDRFTSLTAVCVADAILDDGENGPTCTEGEARLQAYLKKISYQEEFALWQRECLQAG